MDINNNQAISSFRLSNVFAVLIVITLTALLINYLDLIRGKVRDYKRMADMHQIETAISVYQLKFDKLPNSLDDDFNGWDNSLEQPGYSKEFLNILAQEKILDTVVFDPLNNNDYYYRYQKFPANSFGCKKPFAVLQIMNFEVYSKEHGVGSCPEKDFAAELPNGYTIQIFE